MPRLPSNNRKYELTHLWDIHKEITRRLAMGQKREGIAKDLGVSTAMVSYTANSKIGRERREVLAQSADAKSAEIMRRIQEMAPKALSVLDEIMENAAKDADRRLAATDILDRAGFGAVKRFQEVPNDNVLEAIKQKAKEIGRESGASVVITKNTDNIYSSPSSQEDDENENDVENEEE